MRSLIVAGVLAALGSAALVVPAFASFDPHFNVLAKEVSGHSSDDALRSKTSC